MLERTLGGLKRQGLTIMLAERASTSRFRWPTVYSLWRQGAVALLGQAGPVRDEASWPQAVARKEETMPFGNILILAGNHRSARTRWRPRHREHQRGRKCEEAVWPWCRAVAADD